MTAAHCGSITALTLGLPAATAIPEQKGTLPTAMFYATEQVSVKLGQRFVNDIDSITMLAIMRPANTDVPETPHLGEILVIGVHHSCTEAPVEVLDHIAQLRRSGIVFVCVHDNPGSESQDDGEQRPQGEISALAVRRLIPGKPGHPQQAVVLVGPWKPSQQAKLELHGSNFEELWDALCSQAILGSTDGSDFDARLAVRERVRTLKAEEVKLSRDHARTKQPAQRNEIYAKLHKVRTELGQLQEQTPQQE